MRWNVLMILVALAVFAGACTTAVNTADGTMAQDDAMIKDNEDAMAKDDDAMMEETEDGMIKDDDAMMKDEDTLMKEDSMMENSFMGMVLAGETTPYVEFTQEDYDKAVAEGKTIYLEFYAKWCPNCLNDASNIESFWESQTNKDAIAFRVNYKDADTNKAEEDMAKKFGITSQHTRVIIKDGEEVYRKIGNFKADEVATYI